MNMSTLRACILCISTIGSFASTQVMSMDTNQAKKIKRASSRPDRRNYQAQQPYNYVHQPHSNHFFVQQPGSITPDQMAYHQEKMAPTFEQYQQYQQYMAQMQQNNSGTPTHQTYQPESIVLAIELKQPRQPQIATAVHEIDPAADWRLFERYSNYAAEQQRLNS